MITAHLKGGLGNQMFQFAGAKARAKDAPVCLNVFEIEHAALGDTRRPFALDAFVLGPTEITRAPYRLHQKIRDRLMRLWQSDWGYFQSEEYFVHEAQRIRDAFRLRAPSTAYATWEHRIQEIPTAVSLHVRRGDYVQNPHVLRDFGICSPQYYTRACEYMKAHTNTPTFFVFSDDIAWVKEQLAVPNAVYVEDSALSPAEELMLMRTCAHHIIANSSFSWWGAWLNPKPEKIVIAPTPWFDRTPYNAHIIPSSWIQLKK